jgi:hypothetical protein
MPKVENGFVEYSDEELYLMREKGLCITCDLDKTCQIRYNNLQVQNSWSNHRKTINIIVSICSEHEVQGIKDFGVRGSD